MADPLQVIYWDTSATLSAFFIDKHSETARRWAAEPAEHLISSLAYAEACSVIRCMARDGIVPQSVAAATIKAIEQGIWRRINAVPDWQSLEAWGKGILSGARTCGISGWQLPRRVICQN